MQNTIYFLVTILVICILSAANQNRINTHFVKLEAQQSEVITIYTPIDIIYLEGNKVTTETGDY